MGFLLGNFLLTIGYFVRVALGIYSWVVIAAVIVTWLPIDRGHPAVRLLDRLTEPLFSALRRRAPFLVQGGIDLTPVAVLLAIQLIRSVAARSLIESAHQLR